ncbi:MAG: MATE family efflux transporter [Clostridia bacterium]|nr:MATE family efflux transporter [Clostridia bacterium]
MSIKKYIGDRKFYRSVLAIAVPIMIQNGFTNLVNLLDNIMVGRLGTESMSGVSIVNQFIFIFNLLIFGAVSAAGIFTSQYHGLGDEEGVRHTFRFKLLINLTVGILGILVFGLFDDGLINLFLHEGSAEGDLVLTLSEGKRYLAVMLVGFLPYAVSQVYASTMREVGQTVLPMIASIAAVVTNFVLNCVLIFGMFGMPAFGVAGAAAATVASRFAELAILVIWGHRHTDRCKFLVGAYRSMRIPKALMGRIALKGLPLMVNELFWSLSVTMRNQCYSTRGLDVVAAQNINSTIENLVSVVYMALGTSISIVVGNLLGAGRIEEAKDADRKMMAFSVTCALLMAGILAAISPLFPRMYNTGDAVRELAGFMMIVTAVATPFRSFAHAAYFTLRSGGKVMITLLFDSVYMWVIVMPVAFVLAHFTTVSIHWMFILCQGVESAKFLLGAALLKRGSWATQLVKKEESAV